MSLIGAENTRDCGQEPSLSPAQLRENVFVPSMPQPAGFLAEIGHHDPDSGALAVRPLSTQWLSDERVAETRRVWSKAYGRVISEEEAVEILMNVRRLAEVLLIAEEGKPKS